ncbi:MAG: aminotransferase class V-fold PLP-dependent enzyme [Alphaproteobacteria bacterium]|nr:aminotransferase class V-fold PLP-dependent enzyme [Alphaproteobacteria bacterium]
MIYLDHNATSPLLPEVRDAMEPWLGVPANPSSVHAAGRAAARAVEAAAAEVAALVGGRAQGVVFTSGATEANHAWFHAMRAEGRARTVAVGAFEHPCVLAAARRCEAVIDVPMGPDGRARLEGVPATDGTSLMAVNHETGVVQPLAALRERSGWRHVDATAGAGRLALDLGWAEAVVLSAHKLGGPMGVGALVVQGADPFPPLLEGGSQQRGRRAGTVPTPLVVGFGAAAHLARVELDARRATWATQRERLVRAVRGAGGEVVGEGAVPSVVDAVFAGLPAETLVQALDLRGICASAGAACASGSIETSPVLLAMGHAHADGGLRVSLGPCTTDAEVDAFCEAIGPVVEALRSVLG